MRMTEFWATPRQTARSIVIFMSDAPQDEASATAVHRRNPYVVVLLAVGALAAIAGLIWGLAAKASADHTALGASSMPTLPVHVYTQYTQHFIVPDYMGLWIGLLVAVLGVIILLAGVVVAITKPRLA
jgi:hypothetical protein